MIETPSENRKVGRRMLRLEAFHFAFLRAIVYFPLVYSMSCLLGANPPRTKVVDASLPHHPRWKTPFRSTIRGAQGSREAGKLVFLVLSQYGKTHRDTPPSPKISVIWIDIH